MLNFELTLDEANVILMALSKAPYEQVAQVIAKMQNQAKSQLEEKQESTQESAKAD